MTKATHAAVQTASDVANAEADALFKACRFDEAVRLLSTFLDETPDLPPAERLRAKANLAAFERGRGDYRRALEIHKEAAPLVDACYRTDPKRCGMFSNGLGLTYLRLMRDDPKAEDLAIHWFTSASVYYEAADEWGLKRDVENNLAVLHAEAGRAARAREHLANVFGCGPIDEAVRGQVEDTQALIALAEGDAKKARAFARASVERLERVGELRILRRSQETLARVEQVLLRETEERAVREVLDGCGWNITRAARCLGMSREAFKHELRRKYPRLDEERLSRLKEATISES